MIRTGLLPLAIALGVMVLGVRVHLYQPAFATEFEPLDPLADTKMERIEKFVAADAFKIGNRIGGRTLTAVGLNFSEHFVGIVERDVPGAWLKGWSLLYTTGDKSLVAMLGGEEVAAVPSIAYIHRLMEMGDEGPGHTDWRSNFAYVRSPVDRRLWAVHWTVNFANEWTIGAVLVPHPHLDWRSGSRLFSPLAKPGSQVSPRHSNVQFIRSRHSQGRRP